MRTVISWLIWAIVFYLILRVTTYLINFKGLLKKGIRCPTLTITPFEELPPHLLQLWQKALVTLHSLGWNSVASIQLHDMYDPFLTYEWCLLLHHPQSFSYALMKTTYPPESIRLIDVEFYTFLQDKSLLYTMNGKVYGLLDKLPNTIMNDPYATQLEQQWQSHFNRLQELTRFSHTFQTLSLSTEEFIDALNVHFANYVNTLHKDGKIIALQGTNLYKFTWSTAARFTWQLLTKNDKFTVMIKRLSNEAKNKENLITEIPIEIEVKAFHRIQKVQQGNIKRRVNIWIFLVSLVFSFLSFTVWYRNLEVLLVLVGIIFFHEGGHWLAMKIFGYQNTSIYFIPFFGGIATGRKNNANLTEKIIVLLAGPIPGIVLGIAIIWLLRYPSLFWVWDIIKPSSWMLTLANMLLLINIFNLLPILPLDGGKVAQILWFSRHPYADLIFKIITIIILVFLWWKIPILLIIAILLSMSILNDLRVNKVNKVLQQYLQNLESNDLDILLPLCYQSIRDAGFSCLSFTQRYTMAKALLELQSEAKATLLTRIGLSVVYISCLIGSLVMIRSTIF